MVCVGKHSTNEVVSWLCCSATAVWDLGAAACEGVAAPVPSSYFHIDGEEATFYYSYETCSHDNSFTDSADDDQACNAGHSETASWCAPSLCEQVDTNDDSIVGVDDLLMLLAMYGDTCSAAGR